MATSLDGFIARKDHDIDWLNEANALVPPGEDCGYQDFMDSVDVLIMGRRTYEKVLSFGEWPYGDKPVIVLSSNSLSFPLHIPDSVTHSSEKPEALLARLSVQGVEHVYVDGGSVVQSFLTAGLIDEVTLTIIPILLGDGIRLFGRIEKDIHLSHVRTKAFDFGFVQTTYAIQN